MTTERRALAQAITRAAYAMQKVKQAENTLQKANNFLCQLQADRAEAFQDLDNQLASARVSILKRALDNDEDVRPITAKEPEGFASALVARQQLDERIQGIEATIPALEAELETAKQQADEASVAREHAAEAVIAVEAEATAQSFMSKLEDLRREHYILASLMNRWISRAPSERTVNMNGSPVRGVRQIKLPQIVGVAAAQPILGDSELKGGARVRDAVTAAVSNYWQNLKSDASAVLDMEELAQAGQPLSIVVPEVTFTEEELRL